jgi:hypothetical protein
LNKSLFLLPVALAFALTFVGCSSDSDSGSGTDHYYPGYVGQSGGPFAEIEAAFDAGAPSVELTSNIALGASDQNFLYIPGGKSLDLKGHTITPNANKGAIIIAEGGIVLASGTDTQIDLTNSPSYFVANSTLASKVGTAGMDTPILLTNGGSYTTINEGTATAIFATTNLDASYKAALAAGSLGALLGSLPSEHIVIGEKGILFVTQNSSISDSGTVAVTGGDGILKIHGKLTSTANAGTTVVGGTLEAKSLETTGGIYTGPVTLTGPTANNILKTGKTTFSGGLVSLGDVNISSDVVFTEAGTVYGNTTVSGAAKLTGAAELYAAKGVNINGAALTISEGGAGGTLLTGGVVTFNGTGPSIVMGSQGVFTLIGNGKLTTTNYELSGAGSILLNYDDETAAGSLVTLSATGITGAGGFAGGTPTLVFGGAKEYTLHFKDDTMVTGVALDVSNGGSLTLASSKKITIKGGDDDDNMAGSIVAGADAKNIAGTLGGGVLIIAASGITATSGEGYLIGGTADQASVAAGSIGTVAYYIAKGAEFVEINPEGGSTAAWAQEKSAASYDNTKLGGSIAVFTVITE